MKKTINILAIAIALVVIISSNNFAQGNFTTEWESPTGWSDESICKLDINSNVLSLILVETTNENNVRIYNGATHDLSYSWSLNATFPFYGSIFGVEYGNSRFYTKQFDINGDGKNEIIQQANDIYKIVDPTNGNVLYTTGNTFTIIDIDADGFVELVERRSNEGYKIVSTPAQTVSVNSQNEVVKDYDLKQNYPNPFNPITTIEYNLNRNSSVKVIVYDILGKEVSTLVNEKQSAGNYKINLDGTGLSSGTYFYNLVVDGAAESKKMILIR